MEEMKDIYEEERPWGSFRRFIHNVPATVKILNIKSKQELSLQIHNKRSEFWKVIKGKGFFQINDLIKKVEEGDEQFIPLGTKHRIIGGDESIQVLEIGFGDFDENDVVRFEDKYGRV